MPPTGTAPIELLVVQPTPFCNLDCDYCYLPHRGDRTRMAPATLGRLASHIVAAGWLADDATLVWHAGEPMALPPDWYAAAITLLDAALPPGTRLTHSFQTNGTLLHRDWLELLARPDVRLGISLDGPADLHDARRRRRDGGGSHGAVMRGVRLVQDAGIPFHVIAVLTRRSLAEPDRLFDFFAAEGIDRIAFNVEEIEGVNRRSTLSRGDAQAACVAFLRRWLERMSASADPPWVRELDRATRQIMRVDERPPPNQQAEPLRILSVDVHGRLAAFSPELLGMVDDRHGPFVFGDLAHGGPEQVLADTRFRQVREEIDQGRAACAAGCRFHRWCGGGAPANKLFETGSFAATETLYCRLAEQAPLLAVLEAVEAAPFGATPQEAALAG